MTCSFFTLVHEELQSLQFCTYVVEPQASAFFNTLKVFPGLSQKPEVSADLIFLPIFKKTNNPAE